MPERRRRWLRHVVSKLSLLRSVRTLQRQWRRRRSAVDRVVLTAEASAAHEAVARPLLASQVAAGGALGLCDDSLRSCGQWAALEMGRRLEAVPLSPCEGPGCDENADDADDVGSASVSSRLVGPGGTVTVGLDRFAPLRPNPVPLAPTLEMGDLMRDGRRTPRRRRSKSPQGQRSASGRAMRGATREPRVSAARDPSARSVRDSSEAAEAEAMRQFLARKKKLRLLQMQKVMRPAAPDERAESTEPPPLLHHAWAVRIQMHPTASRAMPPQRPPGHSPPPLGSEHVSDPVPRQEDRGRPRGRSRGTGASGGARRAGGARGTCEKNEASQAMSQVWLDAVKQRRAEKRRPGERDRHDSTARASPLTPSASLPPARLGGVGSGLTGDAGGVHIVGERSPSAARIPTWTVTELPLSRV